MFISEDKGASYLRFARFFFYNRLLETFPALRYMGCGEVLVGGVNLFVILDKQILNDNFQVIERCAQ